MQRSRNIVSVGLFCLAVALFSVAPRITIAADTVPTPPGITTYDRGDGTGFADANGMTLYSVLDDPRFRTDPRFKMDSQLCTGPCLESWTPLLAPAGATPVGDWTIVAGAAGTKQWAYRDFPLFTYKLEAHPHQTSGDGFLADIGIVGLFKIWRVIYEPLPTPPGLSIHPAQRLLARVVADSKNMTAYTFDNDKVGKSSACVGECLRTWRPILAPQLVIDVDKVWSTVRREDGSAQWTHKGRPLYTYQGDAIPGEAKGDGIDNVWHAAVLRRSSPRPDDITVSYSDAFPEFGPVYADKGGKSLYAFYHDDRERLKEVCNADCMKAYWRPAVTPSAVKGFGPWTTIPISDGAHQWTYQGKPVFTFAKDNKAGDMLGIHFGYPGDQSGSWGPVQARPPS